MTDLLKTFREHPDVNLSRQTVALIVENAAVLQVTDDVSCQQAVDVVAKITTIVSSLDIIRKAMTKPLDAQKKALIDAQNSICDPLNVQKGHLAKKVEIFLVSKALAQAAENKQTVDRERADLRTKNAGEIERLKLENAAARNELSSNDITLERMNAIIMAIHDRLKRLEELGDDTTQITEIDRTKSGKIRSSGAIGSATVQSAWGYTIDDLSAVPRQYLCVDRDAVSRAIASGVRAIPGLSITETMSAQIRSVR